MRRLDPFACRMIQPSRAVLRVGYRRCWRGDYLQLMALLKNSLFVKVLNDIEVDAELASTKQAVIESLQKSIKAQTELLHAIDYRDEQPSSIGVVSSLNTNLLALVARMELLDKLHRLIHPEPPKPITEADARRLVDEHWKDMDRQYNWWDATKATTSLLEQGVIKKRLLPKSGQVRYTFVKQPDQFPHAYSAWRHLLFYWKCDDDGATSVSVDWDNVQSDVPRIVAEQPVTKTPRSQKR